MTNIAIINLFPPKRVDYSKILANYKENVYIFTDEKYREYYQSYFSNVYGFENALNINEYLLKVCEVHKVVKFERIVSLNEFDLLESSIIREYLELEGQKESSAKSFRDKLMMKDTLNGVINLPKYTIVENVIDIFRFIEENNFPVIVKPRNGAGSMGVKKIENTSQLSSFISEVNSVSNSLIEEVVDGDMYHLDGLYDKGELLLYVPSKYVNTCMSFNEGSFLGSINLSNANPLFYQLKKNLEKVLSTLETPDHMISYHAEFFVKQNGDIIFCEIGSRVGGGMIPELINEKYGIDLFEQSLVAQLPKHMQSDIVQNIVKYSDVNRGWVVIPPKKGHLVDITFSKEPWIISKYFNRDVIGKTFSKASSSVDSIIMYMITGENHEEIETRMNELVLWQYENSEWE